MRCGMLDIIHISEQHHLQFKWIINDKCEISLASRHEKFLLHFIENPESEFSRGTQIFEEREGCVSTQ